MTYQAILATAATRRLNLGQPRLRLLPPPGSDPEPTPDEILAWAKTRAARGKKFLSIRVTAPATRKTKPRQQNNPATRYLLNRQGKWYFHRWTNGRLTRISLHTQDLTEAQRLRDELLAGLKEPNITMSCTAPKEDT